MKITYSLADQNFAETKSVGIFNLSMTMAEVLANRQEVSRLAVLTNHTLSGRLNVPDRVTLIECNRAICGRLQRMLWDQWGVYDAARKLGNEWLFLPKGFASFLRPCPVNLATCVADIMHEFYREKYPAFGPRLEQLYFRRAFAATMRHSRIVFTISDFTTAEVKRLARKLGWKIPAVQTIGIGFRREAHPSTEKHDSIVVLAGRVPHKRTDLAVRFMNEWQRRTKFNGLVDWIGRLPDGLTLPGFANWRRHDRLPEVEFRQLIARAKALLFFSEYEGFGMPPVEAVIAGTCPVFSKIPATQEVMEDCGCAFSNEDYRSFEIALNRALITPTATLSNWAEHLLDKHNPDKVINRVIRGLQEAAQERNAD